MPAPVGGAIQSESRSDWDTRSRGRLPLPNHSSWKARSLSIAQGASPHRSAPCCCTPTPPTSARRVQESRTPNACASHPPSPWPLRGLFLVRHVPLPGETLGQEPEEPEHDQAQDDGEEDGPVEFRR